MNNLERRTIKSVKEQCPGLSEYKIGLIVREIIEKDREAEMRELGKTVRGTE